MLNVQEIKRSKRFNDMPSKHNYALSFIDLVQIHDDTKNLVDVSPNCRAGTSICISYI